GRRSRPGSAGGGSSSATSRSRGVGLDLVAGREVRAAETPIALEMRTEVAEGVVEPGLDRAELDPEDLGRLLEREALEVVEDDDAAMLLGQRRDPFADDEAELFLLGTVGRQRAVVGAAGLGGLIDRIGRQPPPGQ